MGKRANPPFYSKVLLLLSLLIFTNAGISTRHYRLHAALVNGEAEAESVGGFAPFDVKIELLVALLVGAVGAVSHYTTGLRNVNMIASYLEKTRWSSQPRRNFRSIRNTRGPLFTHDSSVPAFKDTLAKYPHLNAMIK